MRIGVDFDNTIVCYDEAFADIAKQEKLISNDFPYNDKTKVRDAIRVLDNGEYHWQRLQGLVYGKMINRAKLFEGVKDFFAKVCNDDNIEVFIVSHKTELAHHDPDKTNLRSSALSFLEENNFFSHIGLKRENVFFKSERDDKIKQIKDLQCDIFIDDLPEVLLDKNFPQGCRKIFFSKTPHDGLGNVDSWDKIKRDIFQYPPLARHAGEGIYLNNLLNTAQKLSPAPVTGITEINKGGNNRLYKISTDTNNYVLKCYPKPSANDRRNRLETEKKALDFMQENGFSNVPAMAAFDIENHYGLLSWCEGESMEEISHNDIEQFAGFLIELARISPKAYELNLPYASEACISGDAILSHINGRLTKLQAAAENHPDLKIFLQEKLQPLLQEKTGYAKAHLDFSQETDRSLQILIPSDFGTHNCLKHKGKINFLDFEYFGWDDAVTATANFILHPAMQDKLNAELQQYFMAIMAKYFDKADSSYSLRLQLLLPLYAIRWTTIILGEFLPERWQHRVKSGQYKEEDKQKILQDQLKKAKRVLEMKMPEWA